MGKQYGTSKISFTVVNTVILIHQCNLHIERAGLRGDKLCRTPIGSNNNNKRFLVRANMKSSSYSSCWQCAAGHKAEPYVLLLSADLLKC